MYPYYDPEFSEWRVCSKGSGRCCTLGWISCCWFVDGARSDKNQCILSVVSTGYQEQSLRQLRNKESILLGCFWKENKLKGAERLVGLTFFDYSIWFLFLPHVVCPHSFFFFLQFQVMSVLLIYPVFVGLFRAVQAISIELGFFVYLGLMYFFWYFVIMGLFGL